MLCVGDVFAGYVIERVLGGGGMGEVYLARHPRLPRSVALKLLNVDFATDTEIRGRFEREADLIARLDHPNIVSVYDRGVEDGRMWMSMQYIDGIDASAVDPAPLPPQRAVHIVGEIAKALDFAHSTGVLHRDVKPANIMIARPAPGYGERILLADFGIGRLRDDTGHLTRTGHLTATLSYASPEQLSGATPGPRSDQYSVACSLFWLLCGTTPFAAESVAAVVAGHLHYPPPPVSARRPFLPPALDGVLFRALAKNPDERFGSCTEFAQAAASALAVPTAVVPPEPTRAQMPAAEARRPWRRMARWRLPAAAAGLVVVLAAVIGIVWATTSSGSSGSSSTSSTTAPTSKPAIPPAAVVSGMQPIGELDEQGNLVGSTVPGPYPAVDGPVNCAPVSIAMAGPLSGANAVLGGNVLGGVRLAVDQFDRKNPGCQVTVKNYDTLADPIKAAQLAPAIVADASTVALIGPTFSGETQATGQTFSNAGLPFLSPSATNVTLLSHGWHSFFQGLAMDTLQAPGMARYLVAKGYHHVCVVADNSDYGAGLARATTQSLGGASLSSCAVTVQTGAKDFGDAVKEITAAAPDAVFYAGYYTESGGLLQQLRAAGSTAVFASGDGSFDPGFLSGAGSAASGALLSCLCGPASAPFDFDYRTLINTAPGVYSPEAYDLTAIVLHGIASGHVTRADLLRYIQSYSGDGIAHSYRWTSTGELAEPRIWLYKAR
ncbi:ABC transporter substrate-binding protein [Nocardia sp. NPDC020380]|uniref:bifunctional serine/threonine-protein kinase/ABC transporter substrate-binding protein n=1 Tax=Nocardia sp. NPDC020380 TaxID=3364309 RepID=UPI0037A77DE8